MTTILLDHARRDIAKELDDIAPCFAHEEPLGPVNTHSRPPIRTLLVAGGIASLRVLLVSAQLIAKSAHNEFE